MNSRLSTSDRVAVIAAIAQRWPSKKLGRTALVKAAYFLQTVRNVPLGYHFRLYSYGPYDSAVLDDLDIAETFGKVEVRTVHYPGGYGYEISRPESSPEISNSFVEEHSSDIEWVAHEFGSLNAAELELAATALYADRELPNCRIDSLVERVYHVKPHFPVEQIKTQVSSLHSKGLLSIR